MRNYLIAALAFLAALLVCRALWTRGGEAEAKKLHRYYDPLCDYGY